MQIYGILIQGEEAVDFTKVSRYLFIGGPYNGKCMASPYYRRIVPVYI